jgi:hypothetical protein
MDTVASLFVINLLHFSYLDSDTPCVQKTAYLFMEDIFLIICRSSTFLLEIITLVSSVNILGTDEVFTVGRSFI